MHLTDKVSVAGINPCLVHQIKEVQASATERLRKVQTHKGIVRGNKSRQVTDKQGNSDEPI